MKIFLNWVRCVHFKNWGTELFFCCVLCFFHFSNIFKHFIWVVVAWVLVLFVFGCLKKVQITKEKIIVCLLDVTHITSIKRIRKRYLGSFSSNKIVFFISIGSQFHICFVKWICFVCNWSLKRFRVLIKPHNYSIIRCYICFSLCLAFFDTEIELLVIIWIANT